MKYIKDQIEEIGSDKSLLGYGFFLALTHIVTFFFWHNNTVGQIYLSSYSAHNLCWPFSWLGFCEFFKFLSPLGVEFLLFFYLNLGVLSSFLFLYCFLRTHKNLKNPLFIKRPVGWAYVSLTLLNLIKLYMFFLDFRMMGNYHYMPFLVTFVYLFLRGKSLFIPLLIICFYVFAGLLKISNYDWLTGLVFSKNLNFPLFFNETAKSWLCFYVVCLELIGSWFLISNKHTWQKIFFVQFVIFHIMSYFIVGYFYPLIMLCLLSFFPLKAGFLYCPHFLGVKHTLVNTKPLNFGSILSILKPGKKRQSLAVGFCFGLLVIGGNVLSVFIPGRAGQTGEGRLYGLNMFDSHVECDSQIFLKFKLGESSSQETQDKALSQQKIIQESFSGYTRYSLRIRCDPYIDFNTTQKLCAYYEKDPDFIDLDWFFYSRIRSDLEYKKIVSEHNVCKKKLKLSSWRKNAFIKI